jgi:hypothetical protein
MRCAGEGACACDGDWRCVYGRVGTAFRHGGFKVTEQDSVCSIVEMRAEIKPVAWARPCDMIGT